MATIPTIQLFRNSIIKTGRQAAIDALEAQKAFVADGGLILARYSEDGTDNGVKTLLGIVRNGGGTNVQLTVIDVEGAAKNVQDAITSAINGLNQVDSPVDGQYVSSVSEDKGIITVTRKPLPSFDEKTDSGKAITAITQTNGEVSVKFGGVAAANVSVADTSDKFTATNVEGALLEIKTSLDNAIGTGGTVEEQITNKINALNSETVSGNGQVITAISQSNGVVNATADTLSADNVAFTSSDTAFTSNNVSAALDALYAQSGEGSRVTLENAEGSEGSNVLKVYTIKQGNREVGTINIPKDLVVTSGSVVKGTWNDGTFTEEESGSGTALKLVIANQEAPVYINTLDLVKDHTAGNGIAISDTNEISVKKASDSEPFLTVGADGVKLSGVQNAINTAAASAKTKVEKTDGGSHVTLTSTTSTTDSSVTYTISESDIASANALTAETTARESADTALSDRLGDGVTSDSTATAQFAELSNKLGTGVTTAEGETVTEQLQALSGRTDDASGVTSVEGAKAYAKKYADELVNSLNATITSPSETTEHAMTIVQTNGKIASITLGAFDCGTYN